MLRSFALMLILSLSLFVFSPLSPQAQQKPLLTDLSTLPFAYLTVDPAFINYDLHIVDIRTGKPLYEIATDDIDCPVSFSPDRQWLFYTRETTNPAKQYFFLLNLVTGDTVEISNHPYSSSIRSVWSEDQRYVAFWLSTANEPVLHRYDVINHVEEVFHSSATIVDGGFIDSDLLYITMFDNGLNFHRWSSGKPGDNNDLVDTYFPEDVDVYLGNAVYDPNKQQLYLTLQNHFYLGVSTAILDLVTREIGYIPQPLISPNIFTPPLKEVISHKYRSPDGGYLGIKTYAFDEGKLINTNYKLYILDLTTGMFDPISGIGHSGPFVLGGMKWVSDNQLAYTWSDSGTPHKSTDLYVYNVKTGQSIRLTDTPELNEVFSCAYG